MARNSPDREARRRIARMEAKRDLRRQQQARRKRDNIAAGVALAALIAGAVAVQLTVFAANPTPSQMEQVRQGLEDPAAAPSPSSSTNAAHIPSPEVAAGKVFSGTIATNEGDIGVELDGKAAPQATAVFSTLAKDGFFEGKTCHRLTTATSMGVLQCGSVDGAGSGDPEYQWGPVENTPEDGVYPAGTIAVARGANTYSNGTQLFIAWKDSTIPQDTGGYTIMGKVTEGLDVLKQIAAGGVEDANSQDGPPKIPVTIKSFTLQ
ncbi:peptidylprolyl isomerase [Arthrobacter sulfonylureivorans]|uniref:Peptidylprolyl isomerase n=1 Tax=Arthrobacter sulfonylureivorans TaxID=2486855 RepID=A0ABY3W2U0_9MICC|nr:peptidylprolyl isomerase [Arthrobacter sulfonylureivorans]UNK44323.1 peptidylprolyl isomerase [Arthrobacter sulfonylureivorans]